VVAGFFFVTLPDRTFAHRSDGRRTDWPLTAFPALTTLSDGIQRKRTASLSDPAFLLDDSECCSLEMPNLRAPPYFHSVV
jgi:hypothetical protein